MSMFNKFFVPVAGMLQHQAITFAWYITWSLIRVLLDLLMPRELTKLCSTVQYSMGTLSCSSVGLLSKSLIEAGRNISWVNFNYYLSTSTIEIHNAKIYLVAFVTIYMLTNVSYTKEIVSRTVAYISCLPSWCFPISYKERIPYRQEK